MILVDDDTAIMEAEDFRGLGEYSCSLPTGTTVGTRWKCKNDYYDESKGWVMAEYIDIDNPNLIGIRWRELIVV